MLSAWPSLVGLERVVKPLYIHAVLRSRLVRGFIYILPLMLNPKYMVCSRFSFDLQRSL